MKDHFAGDSKVLQVDKVIGQFKARQADDIWALFFFKGDQLQERQADAIKTLATKMRGIVRVTVADCLKHGQFCRQFGV